MCTRLFAGGFGRFGQSGHGRAVRAWLGLVGRGDRFLMSGVDGEKNIPTTDMHKVVDVVGAVRPAAAMCGRALASPTTEPPAALLRWRAMPCVQRVEVLVPPRFLCRQLLAACHENLVQETRPAAARLRGLSVPRSSLSRSVKADRARDRHGASCC